jgi:hypothetical protein
MIKYKLDLLLLLLLGYLLLGRGELVGRVIFVDLFEFFDHTFCKLNE